MRFLGLQRLNCNLPFYEKFAKDQDGPHEIARTEFIFRIIFSQKRAEDTIFWIKLRILKI